MEKINNILEEEGFSEAKDRGLWYRRYKDRVEYIDLRTPPPSVYTYSEGEYSEDSKELKRILRRIKTVGDPHQRRFEVE